MSDTLEPKVMAILDKDPTDIQALATYSKEYGIKGENEKIAVLAQLVGEKLGRTESLMADMVREIKLLRTDIKDIKNITPTLLVSKLEIYPELTENFQLIKTSKGHKISYLGKTDKASVYEGYERLHLALIDYYGHKEVTYNTIATALVKYFLRVSIGKGTTDRVTTITEILDTADFLYYSNNKKRFTIPQLRKHLNYVELSSREIKTILVEGGWKYETQGKCRTLLFRKL